MCVQLSVPESHLQTLSTQCFLRQSPIKDAAVATCSLQHGPREFSRCSWVILVLRICRLGVLGFD